MRQSRKCPQVFNNLFKKSIFQNVNMSKFKIFSQLLSWKLLMNKFCGTPCIYIYIYKGLVRLITTYNNIPELDEGSRQIIKRLLPTNNIYWKYFSLIILFLNRRFGVSYSLLPQGAKGSMKEAHNSLPSYLLSRC